MTLAELFPFHRTEVRELVVGSVPVPLLHVFLFVKVVDNALCDADALQELEMPLLHARDTIDGVAGRILYP